jgi:hypothetical protein
MEIILTILRQYIVPVIGGLFWGNHTFLYIYIYICYNTNWNTVGSRILLVQIGIPISTRTNQDILRRSYIYVIPGIRDRLGLH